MKKKNNVLQIGDQFNHFQIRGHIAQGGMSDIYRAYDLISGKDVVLKVPGSDDDRRSCAI